MHQLTISIICILLCVIFQTISACSNDELFEDTLTSEAGVQLAHSDPLYDNVGVLHIDMQTMGLVRGYATVTYIGGCTCLTSAHNFQKSTLLTTSFSEDFLYRYNACFKPKLRVSFKVNGKITYYKVLGYDIHLDYAAGKSHTDITIVQLDREVEGLSGVPLCYDFGEEEICLKNVYENITDENKGEHIPNQLTYVGYGGKDLKNIHNYRTACRSFLTCVEKTRGAYLLYSAGRGVNVYLVDEQTKSSERRFLLPYETGTCPGMSGGPVFWNGKVIAINSFFHSGCVDPVYMKKMNSRAYANYGIRMCNFFLPPFWWNPISTYPINKVLFGVVSGSVPLGAHNEWIEDTKRDFDKRV